MITFVIARLKLFFKLFLKLLLILPFLLFLNSSCRSTNYDPTVSVTLALSQNPKSLDPRFTTDATGQRLNQLIFNSLVRVGDNMTIVGDAATSWTYKDKTYSFTLNKKLIFSDGKALTDEDVLFSFKEYQKDSSPFKSAFEVIENVKSDLTSPNPKIKITLKKYSANFLLDLSLVRLLPKHLVESQGEKFSDHPVGTGAFLLKSKSLNEIVLEARPNHPIYQPKIKYAIFKIILDDSTRFLNAYKGAIDIIQTGLPLNKISYIEKRGKYNIFSYPGPSMNYILLNLKLPVLQNKKLRMALSTALNRDDIIKYKLEGYAEPATSLLPTNNIFHNKSLVPINYLLQDSRKTIQELGLQNKEFILKTSNNPEVVEVAKVIASQLENIGIKIKLQSFEWGTFYSDIRNGNYEMAMMRWVGLSDPDIYRTAFHTKELPPGRNRGFYKNPSLDILLDEGIGIENLDKRIAHYNQVQKIIFDEHVIIPLWYNTLVDVVHKRITNYQAPASGDLSPLYSIEISP